MKVTTQHSVVAPLRPSVPILTAGDNSLTVSWTAPVTGGSAITGYRVKLNGVVYLFPPTTTSHTFTSTPSNGGIQNGNWYQVVVAATNAIGQSPYSQKPTLAYPGYLPAAPGSVSVVPVSTSALQISWAQSQMSSLNGGWGVSRYAVWVINADTNAPVKVVSTVSGAYRQVVVKGLSTGTRYYAVIYPVSPNGAGSGAASLPVRMGMRPPTPQWAVNNLGLRRAEGTIRAWWAAVPDNGSEVTYNITVRWSLDGTKQRFYGTYHTKDLFLVVKHLPMSRFGRYYQFELSASNASGTSASTFKGIVLTEPCLVVPNADCPSSLS